MSLQDTWAFAAGPFVILSRRQWDAGRQKAVKDLPTLVRTKTLLPQ